MISYIFNSWIIHSTLHEFFPRQVKYVRISFSILCVHQNFHHIIISGVPVLLQPSLDLLKLLSELIGKIFVLWIDGTNLLFKIWPLSCQYDVSACFELRFPLVFTAVFGGYCWELLGLLDFLSNLLILIIDPLDISIFNCQWSK
jgi:hypothetical protein